MNKNRRKTYLSKSRYTTFCQCRKALWLNTRHPEYATKDSSIEARFAEGNVIGDLAMGLFGNFTEVTTYTPDMKLDIGAMIDKTRRLMNEGCPVICEASFSYSDDAGRNEYCAVDILKRSEDGWSIYEVKSSSSHEGEEYTDPDKFRKYAIDIAYQKYTLVKCGVNVTGTYLVTLNSDYRRDGDINVKELFNILNLKDLVSEEYEKVAGNTKIAHSILDQEEEPLKDLGMHCNNPYPCAFWNYCTKQLGLDLDHDKETVFSLYRASLKKKLQLFYDGKVAFGDIRHEKLNKIQQMQIECTLNNTLSIDKIGIQSFLHKVTYPLYFLDFESMMSALPQYDGVKPYMQVCFQYSLHYIETEGGELKHKAFLAPSDGTDPRRPLAEALCRDIPKDVCVMAYNDPFEKGRIREMADAFPDLASHLMNIHDNIIDLLIPFRSGYYYTPAMGGSFSIKSVLPALFPDDPELDYHNLDSLVQNGGDAMTIFPTIKDMNPDNAKAARDALLNYCHLDTMAMVRVWEKLKEAVSCC